MRFNDKECANLLLGVLKQAALDKKLSYVSSVGADYSHLTDEGIALLTKTAQLVFINLLKNEQDLLDEKLKEKFMKDLAGKWALLYSLKTMHSLQLLLVLTVLVI